MLQVVNKLFLDLILDHLPGDRQHLLEAGRDIAPSLLLLNDLLILSFFALLNDYLFGLFAGLFDNGIPTYLTHAKAEEFGSHR